MTPEIQARIVDRLVATGKENEPWALIVLAALETQDPVSSLIDDARAVALTEDLPADVASRVVPGFCRSAVEAACMDVLRRRRLARGETHESVEDLLVRNAKLHPLISLALFDDPARTNDVLRPASWPLDRRHVDGALPRGEPGRA